MNTKTRIAIAAFAGAGLIGVGGCAAALATTGVVTTATQVAAATHETHRAARPDSSGFTWHPLHLLDGWQALSDQIYGAPSYAIQNGVLYLSGILQAPQPTSSPEFAVLPAGARPKHYLWVLYYNFGGTGTNLVGNMEIEPNGEMFGYANTGPTLNPSLQAISFPLSS